MNDVVISRDMSQVDDSIIMTTSGPVKGITTAGVRGYLGIAYAAPPNSNLRWKPPVPPEPWKEPRLMDRYSLACPQTLGVEIQKLEDIGENCLTLNIWTPAMSAAEQLPVMVYLHGGGFAVGRGSEPMYNQPYLAKKGVVLVTINYRLGVFGFLAHPALTAESTHHSSGNYGIMDQVMALRWIKENIRQFGGNPNNVTIFGHSAGGGSVITLMASPLAKDLFHRAIAQSCGYISTRIRHISKNEHGMDSMESLGIKFVERLGIKDQGNPLEELRTVPWQELAAAWERTVQYKQTGTGVYGAWMLNHVILDGYVLPQSPGQTFKSGRQHNVPFITGTTADEGTVMVCLMNLLTVVKYRAYLERCFQTQWQDVLSLYPAQSDDALPEAANRLLSDSFDAGSRAVARSMATIQPKTYLYYFTMQPKILVFPIPADKDWQKKLGCYHSAELPYIFQFLPLDKTNVEDRKLSEEMIGYWVRFARSGDPNGDGAPYWPTYDVSQGKHLFLDSTIRVGQHLNQNACDVIDELAEAPRV